MVSEVEPGILIGARPGKGDWDRLAELNIRSVIDLAPELSATTPQGIEHHHLPLLDITIPDPATLDSIARLIEDRHRHGVVYIHCALGMSRSVLAVCSWAMFRGGSKEEALALIDRARPERVQRPYIAISLELFEHHLRAMAVSGG